MIARLNPARRESGRWPLPSAGGVGLSLFALIVSSLVAVAAEPKTTNLLWSLKPVARPDAPAGVTTSRNPIDAFVAAEWRAKGLNPVGPADKRVLLRRVYLDLTGLPPSRAEQEAFLRDPAPDAYEKVVDRLLASDQHAERYARHWLDVLRYADLDEEMIESPGVYLWRDWVIRALRDDVPYDQFVRAQLTGYRPAERMETSKFGEHQHVEQRPDDIFALGFLARGAVNRSGKGGDQELAIAAVETVSTAFMGMTVGCAKCHDHMYDPISKKDFYAMKALFDPLVGRKVTLATAAETVANAKLREELKRKQDGIETPLNTLIAPYKNKLYEERLILLPADVQAAVRKPEKQRTAAEQKIADDYFPVLRIDPAKLKEVMPEPERKQYEELSKQLAEVENARRAAVLPHFWTVEVDRVREAEKSYELTSGDVQRPEKNKEVGPGWPFAPEKIDFREGRVEAFADWLTAPENPLFARVAVNRLWQWHFGEGLQKTASDFGEFGGTPSHPQLLDWLASEFTRGGFGMRQMHRLIVTSDTYKLASDADPALAVANTAIDSSNTFLWRFRLQRLEAEPIWDSILTAAGNLDLAVGGPSFDPTPVVTKSGKATEPKPDKPAAPANRRALYLTRGFSNTREITPAFLQTFDVDDGRVPCPLRTQTVTPPQSLFLMNSPEIDAAATRFAGRLREEAGDDLNASVEFAYTVAVARPPSSSERKYALGFLENNPARLKNFAWLMFNLDEFLYVR